MNCLNCKHDKFNKKTKGNYEYFICKKCRFTATFYVKQDVNLIREIVDYYLEVKNGMPYKDLPQSVKIGYSINLSKAKEYLRATENDTKPIKDAIDALRKWADAKGMSWSFALIGKYLSEQDTFKVESTKRRKTLQEIEQEARQ